MSICYEHWSSTDRGQDEFGDSLESVHLRQVERISLGLNKFLFSTPSFYCKLHTFFLFVILGSDPAWISTETAISCPWETASMSGVFPSLFRQFNWLPLLSSSCTVSWLPEIAEWWRGVFSPGMQKRLYLFEPITPLIFLAV